MSATEVSSETSNVDGFFPRQKILSHLPGGSHYSEFRNRMATVLCGDSKIPKTAFSDMKLLEALSEENSSLEDIAPCVKADPSLNMKIMRISRTAMYSRGVDVESFEDAYYRLGMREIRNLIYAEKVAGGFRKFKTDVDWMNFWKNSVLTARLTEVLMSAAVGFKNFGFINGLLNDTGSLVIREYFPEESMLIARAMQEENKELIDAETEIFGFSHAHVAGLLCLKWRFPYNSSMGVYHHHSQLDEIEDNATIRSYALATYLAENMAKAGLMLESGEDATEFLNYLYDSNVWNIFMSYVKDHDLINKIDLEKEVQDANQLATTLLSS
ncbi:MAG: HDOD domain-containing protein [Verrucomicrobiota bacterium]